MAIKNIIFDNGGVLANPRTGHWYITTNFWKIVGIDKESNFDKINQTMKKYQYMLTQDPKTELEEYKMFVDFYYQVLKDVNYDNLSKEIVEKLASDCVYNDDKYIFYNDVDKEIESLSKKYDLYMITDAWASSFRVFDNRNISKFFKNIMVSAIEGKTKMEGLFEIFLEKNKNIVPQESVFIDDRSDILEKAKQCGFNVLLMNRTNQNIDTPFEVIHNLQDIEKVLNQ